MSNDDYFAQRPAEPGTPPAPAAPPPYAGYGTPPQYGTPPPYGIPPQYGTPPYGSYGYPYAPQKTNGLAIASMVVSIVSIVTCGLFGIAGAIMGHMARKQIRERNEEGAGMATTGIIVGWVITGLTILGIAIWIIFVAAATGGGGFAA
jgi:hypothetical protein